MYVRTGPNQIRRRIHDNVCYVYEMQSFMARLNVNGSYMVIEL